MAWSGQWDCAHRSQLANIYFSDNSGVLSVYSAATTNGYLMASNHGVFKYEDKQFSTVPDAGQAWNISKINNRYLIGHNEGTFVYENDVFSKLNSRNGAGTYEK
jgi:hypothetical protein